MTKTFAECSEKKLLILYLILVCPADVYQWEQIARQKIDSIHAKNSQTLSHSAKNVILFIGDGMGITTVTAARILKSQLPILDNPEWRTDLSRLLQELEKAEEGELFFDSFESVALSKVSSQQVPITIVCMTFNVLDSNVAKPSNKLFYQIWDK